MSTVTEADVTRQVIEYLSKKGYSKTESMLRLESANQDVEGRPISTRAEETGGVKYSKAFGKDWYPSKFMGSIMTGIQD